MKAPAIPKRKTTSAKRKGPPGAHLEDDPTITIAASVPQSVARAAKRRAGAGNFSRFVTSALQNELACSALDELVDGFLADGGAIDEAMVSAARKLIKD
jgi:uncharacterized protein YgbK (DUF1537 family)